MAFSLADSFDSLKFDDLNDDLISLKIWNLIILIFSVSASYLLLACFDLYA